MATLAPLVLLALAASGTPAAAPEASPTQDAALPLCAEPTLQQLPEGGRCRTSKGGEFRLVKRTELWKGILKEVWQDMRTGLLWSDNVDGKMSLPMAREICASHLTLEARGGLAGVDFVLPRGEDFLTAEANGFREALPLFFEAYWAAESTPGTPTEWAKEWGTYFIPRTGRLGDGERSDNWNRVRCVSRRPG